MLPKERLRKMQEGKRIIRERRLVEERRIKEYAIRRLEERKQKHYEQGRAGYDKG
ncbi:unnamed protein product [marine sediment metagenome]|uniref:Uncharacterized protein n=1 Tax=marine sediment metagenome TaxID=412755 RepID=X1F255_9ZZZZ